MNLSLTEATEDDIPAEVAWFIKTTLSSILKWWFETAVYILLIQKKIK
ncbi:MAG TPA: hypothetical protein VN958_11220 [Chitinophagaceae bacterium]|nr:hypothetical protein [Chitinophagaceae bacterium]